MEVTLKKRRREMPDVISFIFTKPSGFAYDPGDYTELELQSSQYAGRRWFTLSSAPHEDYLQFTVKFPPQPSDYKQQLLNMQPGDSAFVSPAIGNFNLPRQPEKLLFVAAGIGITPFVSMQKHLNHHQINHHDIQLVHLARDEHLHQDFFGPNMTKSHLLHSAEDTLTIARLHKLVADLNERIIYLAGPEKLMADLHEAFIASNHPRHRLKLEYFPGHQSL